MDPQALFRVNRPQVVYESFEDELVIINLESGNYFSLSGVGATVWDLIEDGADVGRVTQTVSEQYRGASADIPATLRVFFAELQGEGLIAPATPDSAGRGSAAAEPRPPRAAPLQFETPRLQKYTDMQEMLLLDPIHDVDAAGWPNRPDAADPR